MYLVHIGKFGLLERQTCYNWCRFRIGSEAPDSWYFVKPVSTEEHLKKQFKETNSLHSIAFFNDEDATAFKLVFGL